MGFDLEKRWTRGGSAMTLVVIRDNGRRPHTSGCSFSGTGERSWAAARQMVQALESERQARTPPDCDERLVTRGEVTALVKRLSTNPENALFRKRVIVTRVTEMCGKKSGCRGD
ncbi:MAG TPA: hypothetical protein VF060_04515 [Trebonia sp.]